MGNECDVCNKYEDDSNRRNKIESKLNGDKKQPENKEIPTLHAQNLP